MTNTANTPEQEDAEGRAVAEGEVEVRFPIEPHQDCMHFCFTSADVDGLKLSGPIFYRSAEEIWRAYGFSNDVDEYQLHAIVNAVRDHLEAHAQRLRMNQVRARLNNIAKAARELEAAVGDPVNDEASLMTTLLHFLEPLPFHASPENRRIVYALGRVREIGCMARRALEPDRLGSRSQPAQDKLRHLVIALGKVYYCVTRVAPSASINKSKAEKEPSNRIAGHGPFLRFFQAVIDSLPAEHRRIYAPGTIRRILKSQV